MLDLYDIQLFEELNEYLEFRKKYNNLSLKQKYNCDLKKYDNKTIIDRIGCLFFLALIIITIVFIILDHI